MGSNCAFVILISEDYTYLEALGEASLKARLLVWETRLIVITSLSLNQVESLMISSWTFSHMNSILVNFEKSGKTQRLKCNFK